MTSINVPKRCVGVNVDNAKTNKPPAHPSNFAMSYSNHIEGSQLVLQPRFSHRHADVHLHSEGDNTLCIGANSQTQVRLNSKGVTAIKPLHQAVDGIPRPLLHVANLHEQTDAVFGNSTATRTTRAPDSEAKSDSWNCCEIVHGMRSPLGASPSGSTAASMLGDDHERDGRVGLGVRI